MFYGGQVSDTRKLFFLSWQKYRNNQALLPLEQQLVAVISDHPEYHSLLESQNGESETAYFPELGQTNPFLHMGLHLAIRDQIGMNRPAGITQIYQQLSSRLDPLTVEHLLMDHLAESLWKAQRENRVPDENEYLTSCRGLLD